MRNFSGISTVSLCALLLVSCSKAPPGADKSGPEAPATVATIWPASLNVMGDGFPKPGDPCRRIGESAATVNFLDDSAILVGCPGSASEDAAAAVVAKGGRAVGSEQNITLLSISQGDANVGMPPASETGATQDSPGSTAR
jgi:hypothetical protein